MLLMVLTVVACGSLYLGSAAHIEREGFSIPESYVEVFMGQMEKQIELQVPAEMRQEAVATFRKEFRRTVDQFFQRTVKPYEKLIPLAIAASMFMTLATVTRLLAWLPAAILGALFPLLKALGVTDVVMETREVERLVLS